MEVQKYFLFYKDELIMPLPAASEGGAHFSPTQLEQLQLASSEKIHYRTGSEHELACAIKLSEPLASPALETSTMSVRSASVQFAPATAHAVLAGYARLNWQAAARFCSSCGAGLIDHPAEFIENAARSCPACHKVHYPRISPAMIVLIQKGDSILLAHNANFQPGRFSLLAGFLEAGENIEEAVEREVFEEARITIKNIRYFRSQAWPFPDSLMLGFTADWASGEIEVDGKEILEANWYTRDALPDIPPPGSISRALIDSFVTARETHV